MHDVRARSHWHTFCLAAARCLPLSVRARDVARAHAPGEVCGEKRALKVLFTFLADDFWQAGGGGGGLVRAGEREVEQEPLDNFRSTSYDGKHTVHTWEEASHVCTSSIHNMLYFLTKALKGTLEAEQCSQCIAYSAFSLLPGADRHSHVHSH